MKEIIRKSSCDQSCGAQAKDADIHIWSESNRTWYGFGADTHAGKNLEVTKLFLLSHFNHLTSFCFKSPIQFWNRTYWSSYQFSIYRVDEKSQFSILKLMEINTHAIHEAFLQGHYCHSWLIEIGDPYLSFYQMDIF